MCGIAGIVSFTRPIDPQILPPMSQAIAHRGPDAQGTYLSPDRHITLIHRRLAIIDLDPRANQPFADDLGNQIVFNGEIYNYRELRRELSGAFHTESDTEVLLAAWRQWGADCLSRLNGMFAFAIWDAKARRLFLARDPMGQKPLYYAQHEDRLAFASEIPALMHLDWIDRTIDKRALVHYLRFGYTGQQTIYAGIRKLRPGHWMTFSPNVELGRYFDADAPTRHEGDPVARTRSLVLQSVQRQLVSDVPLGCFLSGGIDSSIITAAAKSAASNVLTFSIGFDDPKYDETHYACRVAAHLGTTHRQFIVRPDAAADLPLIAQTFGEPFADSSILPTHYLARETRQFVKVALSGDGGDELFGGYDRYRAVRMSWPRGPKFLGKLVDGPPKSRRHRLHRFLEAMHLLPAGRYASYIQIFDEQTLAGLLGEAPGYEELAGNWSDPLRAAISFDKANYLPEDLLAKVDRASMLHALEVRSPFLDPHLVGFAAGLSNKELVSKRMLRMAFVADLPAEVFTRPKMGFAVPIGDWLRTSLASMLNDLLFSAKSFSSQYFQRAAVQKLVDEHRLGRPDHTHRLFALLMLELWRQNR